MYLVVGSHFQAQPFEGAEVRAPHYRVHDLGNRAPNPDAVVDDGFTLVPDHGVSPLLF